MTTDAPRAGQVVVSGTGVPGDPFIWADAEPEPTCDGGSTGRASTSSRSTASDDGEVLGLEPDMVTLKASTDGLSLHLTEILNKYLGEVAAASAVISFAPVDGKTVAIVSATPSTHPVFVEDSGSPEFYVRSNASTRLMDVKEATAFIATRWSGVG